MGSVEFALWLNGAVGIVGDEPPTQEQWNTIREKMSEAVGKIVSDKLLEHAEDARKRIENEVKLDVMRQQAKDQMAKHMQQAMGAKVYQTMLGGDEIKKLQREHLAKMVGAQLSHTPLIDWSGGVSQNTHGLSPLKIRY